MKGTVQSEQTALYICLTRQERRVFLTQDKDPYIAFTKIHNGINRNFKVLAVLFPMCEPKTLEIVI